MKRPSDLIDREAEWEQLSALVEDSEPHLAFVAGRRRVGKSYLLSRLSQENNGIYYQATRRTEAEQLAAISRLVGTRFGDAFKHGAVFPTWEDLFAYLLERSEEQSMVFVLDEFPFLASSAPALTSIIQSIWDHQWQGRRLKLILSGSYITAMKQLEEYDQPLYGRRTAKLAFSPFYCWDVKHFVPAFSVRDQFITYGVFGYLPGNLALLKSDLTLAENAASLMLKPTGRLVDDAEHILDAFLGDADVHYSIISAIAQGEHTWSGIANRVGRSGSSISRPIQWLEQMEIVRRVSPITEKDPARSRRSLYRLSDPYIAFWHRYVAPLLRAGSIGLRDPSELWQESLAPRLNNHMGPVFEQVCRDFARRPGVLPFKPFRVGEWWDSSSSHQIDVVAAGARGELLIGEAKWGGVTGRDLDLLRKRAGIIAGELGDVSQIYLALFTASGHVDDEVEKMRQDGNVVVYSGDEILQQATDGGVGPQ